jgi:hypothetical protein
MKLSDPDHPAWDFGRYLILMTAATVILWANASDFDITEGRSLMLLAMAMGGWGGVERLLRHHGNKKDE